jgi:hypothetical protein
MLQKYRKHFFTILAFFFVTISPILVIFSLGYEVDINEQNIDKTLNVKIETVPRNATIKNGTDSFKSPRELRVLENKIAKLNISQVGFLDENFIVSSSLDKNLAARLEPIWLLPDSPVLKNNSGEYKPINFLSQNYILLSKGNQTFIQKYSFSGIQDQPELLSSEIQISNQDWEFLDENIFWQSSSNLLIYNIKNQWKILDLKTLNLSSKIGSVAKIAENQLLILAQNEQLWNLDLLELKLLFLDTGVNGLTFSTNPNNLWLLKYNQIYKFEVQDNNIKIENLALLLNNKIHSQNNLISSLSGNINLIDKQSFSAKNVFLGMVFKIGDTVFYVSDSNKNLPEILSNQVHYLAVDNSSVFIVTENYNLLSYNLLNKSWNLFEPLKDSFSSTEDLSKIRVSYYKTWNRIFIYSENEVVSIWFSTDLVNKPVLKYSQNTWIKNSRCLSKILENYQFCLTDTTFENYKNNSFPW